MGPNAEYHEISITKSILMFFIPYVPCVLTNEKYKIYPMGFLFHRLSHAQGEGLRGTGGQKFNFFNHGDVAYQVK